jgi:hypothetical protein
MPAQIVMDREGDSRFFFDAANGQSLAEAQGRHEELTAKGFRAVVPGKDGKPGRLLSRFDRNVEEALFIPPLVGG